MLKRAVKDIIYLAIVLACLLTAISPAYAEPAMPDSIVRVGACATTAWPWTVTCQDGYAYVGDRYALVIIDISVPSSPSIVGSLRTFHIQPVAVFVADTVAYTIQIGPEFSTASIASPFDPYQLGWCTIPIFAYEPKGLMVVDTLAFVPDAEDGLQVVRVGQPDAPAVIGSLNTGGIARDLFAQTTTVFMADGDSLQIVDVSDPTTPSRLGAVAAPNTCYDVFVVDTLAYVVCESSMGSNGTLHVVNVSDPSNPFIISSVTMNGDPWAVYVSGDYAYVAAADYWASRDGIRTVGGIGLETGMGVQADVEGGVRIIDISDPLSPVLVASYDTPGNPRDVFVVFPYIYVADYDSLQILRHVTTGISEVSQRPQVTQFRLVQNQPNPFSNSTVISYSLPFPTQVTLEIYDISGRLVETLVNETQAPDIHQVRWNRKSNPSGVYFYRLKAGEFVKTRKMVVVE